MVAPTSSLHILVAGCGYIGTALALALAADGHTVWGLRRHPERLPAALQPWAADLTQAESLQTFPTNFDVVFYTAGSNGSHDAAYQAAYVDGIQNLLTALTRQRQRPRQIFFTSSTGVYAQSHGEWVDEDSPTEPVRYSGKRLLEGEQLLLSGPFPATVVRLAGIYGPGRTRLIEGVRQGTVVYSDLAPVYMNLIHRDDCVGVLRHLMRMRWPESLYIGVDHRPVERGTLLRWLAGELGVPAPQVTSAPPDPGTHRSGNKRCRNTRLVQAGYTFRFPTYHTGYRMVLAETQGAAYHAST
jgi:nucleoside-diphosphate-sugar epimerase